MKRLTLLRHAQAEPPDHSISDFERQLTAQGRRAAGLAAQVLKEAAVPIDYIVSSTAPRALATAEHVAQRCGLSVNPRPELYLAAISTHLQILAKVPDISLHTVLVGHNPSIEDLASELAGQRIVLATAGVAELELEIDSYTKLMQQPISARLVRSWENSGNGSSQ